MYQVVHESYRRAVVRRFPYVVLNPTLITASPPQTRVRSLNRVMFGFTLPTDSQVRKWQAQPNLQQGAIALRSKRILC